MGGDNLSEVLLYKAKENRWQALANLPEARAGHAATMINGDTYVFGGEHFRGVIKYF